jgi:Ca2+-binding EF-hand superfamily protein
VTQREELQKKLRDAWAGDPAELFRLLARGRGHVTFSDLKSRQEAELFAAENHLTDDTLTRGQFLKYMAQRDGLRLKIHDRQSAELFKRYDANGDGYLDEEERTKTQVLRNEWQKWDANRDGLISLEEYLAFMRDLFVRQNTPRPPKAKAGPAAEPTRKVVVEEETAAAPLLYRAGAKLPPGVPSWFQELDQDGEGQVSLYRWKLSGRDLEEFVEMDRNEDGFLTVEEVLYYQRSVANGRRGRRKAD